MCWLQAMTDDVGWGVEEEHARLVAETVRSSDNTTISLFFLSARQRVCTIVIVWYIFPYCSPDTCVVLYIHTVLHTFIAYAARDMSISHASGVRMR